ncbi:MAG: DEAD/DEAH box helicase family protein [Synergistaceae bacterium]|nr:DEAD/DEAH box helicase family protein [Synergistaceae bacterium]
MTEEDIKLRFITPALQKGWKGFISMEVSITDGKICVRGNITKREKPLRADYVLYMNEGRPLAVVEAKSDLFSVLAGLQQAKRYAEKLCVPFAYSSNGQGFEEYDYLTGIESFIHIDKFPSREDLIRRYEVERGMTEAEKKVFAERFYTSLDIPLPRSYQCIAVDKVLDAIVLGRKRILLVMATGTGKTYTAFQIVNNLRNNRLARKILYLADRNVLVDQPLGSDFKPLEKVSHKVQYLKDRSSHVSGYEMYFAIYQQLIGDNGEKRYAELFRPDFFDLVVVDECHRGSAKADSQWREILEYFSLAVQIGMTATPRETKYISNINYFGEPVYCYSLNQGIEDGFLAPFRVIEPRMNISDGWRPAPGQCDIFGNEIEDHIYNNMDYDYNIVIQDRTRAVAERITDYLKRHGRMQRTIIFCANEEAAERMRKEIANLNVDMMRKNPDYVVRITSSDNYGKSKLEYFTSVDAEYPVIATTSELLSTGVDTKTVQLIVLDKNISSMTQFKQIIGRGTRIREDKGKLSFTVMDFRGVSRLFVDPEWDGPLDISSDFDPEGQTSMHKPPTQTHRIKPVVDRDGCPVEITSETVSVYDTAGKLLRQENIIDYTKRNIRGEFADLQQFLLRWNTATKKQEITEFFKEMGIDFETLKKEQNMQDTDDFDFICYVAFAQKPLTRAERTEKVKRSDFLSKYSGPAREILEALLERYVNYGVSELENPAVLKIPPFTKYGKPSKIASLFTETSYAASVKELENLIYMAG